MCGFCFSGNKTEKSIPVKAQTPSSVQLANLTPGMMYKLWVFPIWSSPSEHSYITFTTSSGETGFSPAAGRVSEACHIHHRRRHSRGGGRWFDHDCMEQPSSTPRPGRPPPTPSLPLIKSHPQHRRGVAPHCTEEESPRRGRGSL